MPTFEIPDGPTTVELKRSGDARTPGPATGSIAFNVTNTAGDACGGRLGVVVSGDSKEAWFSIDGDRERTFAAGETQTATIKVSVPADVGPGNYPFKLRAVAVNDPDYDHAEGPVATAQAPPAAGPGPTPPKWWLWILIGVVVLLLIIVALWFAFRNTSETPAAGPVAVNQAARMGALEPGIDRFGSDFGAVKVPNAEACAKLCLATEPCLAMTFITPSSVCMMKNAVPNQTPNAQVISAIKIPAK